MLIFFAKHQNRWQSHAGGLVNEVGTLFMVCGNVAAAWTAILSSVRHVTFLLTHFDDWCSSHVVLLSCSSHALQPQFNSARCFYATFTLITYGCVLAFVNVPMDVMCYGVGFVGRKSRVGAVSQ